MIALWFFTGDKLDSLKDSIAHPFAGSGRLVLLDFFLTWVLEYGSSIAMGGLLVLALCTAWRRAEPGLRAVWIWAVLTTLFLGLKSRFHFRYNLVEAPAAALLAAVMLPAWVERVARSLRAPWPAWRCFATAALGAVALAAGAAAALAPGALFEAARAPFAWLYGLRADHFGLSLAPDAYVDYFAREQRALLVHLGGSLSMLGLGLAVLGAAALLLRAQAGERPLAARAVWAALAVALVPGAVRLYARLPGMIEWELECHPQTRAAQDYVASIVRARPLPVRILLGGGWDQLTNNSLRWYLLTRGGLGARFGEVRVEDDMIGSLVFPPEPRIRYWATVLATAPAGELPEHVVLIHPDPERFLYRVRVGPEVAIYSELLAERGGYELAGEAFFPILQARVEVWRRAGEPGPPLSDAEAVLARHGIAPDTPGYGARALIGEDGWTIPDESPRHFQRRADVGG
jgi:hypothetical protein